MIDQIRENSKWFHEKGTVIREYLRGRMAALSAVAGRGFLQMPGFLYDIENDLETDAKRQLSDINFAILQDTIERELKQAGIDYDLSYRNLLMAWELGKQDLMDAWEAELAGIKMDMAGKEEALARLEIETASRGTVLLQAKTEIELEAESLRNQIAALDDDTADYEVSLANAKLLTAQKKLEVIPILQQILAKEEELLASEQAKIPAERELLAAQQATVSKKAELIPEIAELTTVTEQYTGELEEQTALELQIAEQRIIEAGIDVQKAEVRIEEAEARTALEQKNLDLLRAKIATETLGHGLDENVLGAQITAQTTLNTEEKEAAGAINESDRAANQEIIADKEAEITIEEETHLDAIGDKAAMERYRIQAEADLRVQETEEITALEQNTRVTAALTHLLSM